jgi:hypothetical protein
MLAATDQEARPVFGERSRVGLDVLLVKLGIPHIDVDNPVTLRHPSDSFDQHHFDVRRAFAQSPSRLVLPRMKIATRRVVALEFEHDVARSRLAFQRLATATAREWLAAMVGDGLGGRRGA